MFSSGFNVMAQLCKNCKKVSLRVINQEGINSIIENNAEEQTGVLGPASSSAFFMLDFS